MGKKSGKESVKLSRVGRWQKPGADPHAVLGLLRGALGQFPLPPPLPLPASGAAEWRPERRDGDGASGGRAGPGCTVRTLAARRAPRLRRVDRGLGAGSRAAAPRTPERPLRALHGREEPAHPGGAGRSRRRIAQCRASGSGSQTPSQGPRCPHHLRCYNVVATTPSWDRGVGGGLYVLMKYPGKELGVRYGRSRASISFSPKLALRPRTVFLPQSLQGHCGAYIHSGGQVWRIHLFPRPSRSLSHRSQ